MFEGSRWQYSAAIHGGHTLRYWSALGNCCGLRTICAQEWQRGFSGPEQADIGGLFSLSENYKQFILDVSFL